MASNPRDLGADQDHEGPRKVPIVAGPAIAIEDNSANAPKSISEYGVYDATFKRQRTRRRKKKKEKKTRQAIVIGVSRSRDPEWRAIPRRRSSKPKAAV